MCYKDIIDYILSNTRSERVLVPSVVLGHLGDIWYRLAESCLSFQCKVGGRFDRMAKVSESRRPDVLEPS